MSEVKIAERITIDEPHNVEIAIMNLTGRAIDFELIQKFIVNEKNTMFYLNRKLNSSTEYGTYNDYLWLDTGIRDSRNNPIMICLHNVYDCFVGHYTGTVRELANRLKQFKGNNGREIEKNLSRFMSKYKAKAAERLHEIIADEMEYARLIRLTEQTGSLFQLYQML